MAELITDIDPALVRERLAEVRSEAGEGVRVLVATKYVPDDELPGLADAGVDLVGENRLDDLERKHERFGELFEWHFIGGLQSRKVKGILPLVTLIHSVASRIGPRSDQLARPRRARSILVQVNVAGEEAKEGIAPSALGEFIARSEVEVAGLATMPPFAEDPEASRIHFSRLAEPRCRARSDRALDGNEPGLASRGGGRRDHRQARLGAPAAVNGRIRDAAEGHNRVKETRTPGANRGNQWHSEIHGTARSSTSASPRTRITTSPISTSRKPARTPPAGYDSAPAPRATVSRLGDRRRGQDEIDDIFADEAPPSRSRNLRPVGNGGGGGADVRVHLVNPDELQRRAGSR